MKKGLPNFKDIGNQSTHGRRYNARKSNLEAAKKTFYEDWVRTGAKAMLT